MIDLYVYYRVKAANAAVLASRVQTMQAMLGTGQIKRRPDEKDGLQTWMEVYTCTSSDFAERLAHAALEAGVHQYIEGDRHTEVFMDLV